VLAYGSLSCLLSEISVLCTSTYNHELVNNGYTFNILFLEVQYFLFGNIILSDLEVMYKNLKGADEKIRVLFAAIKVHFFLKFLYQQIQLFFSNSSVN
jgi:hypothetical protein